MLYDIITQHPVLALVIFATVVLVLFCENHREFPILCLCTLLLIAFLVNESDKEKETLKEAKYEVTWEYVNIRDDANGNIIGRLEKGQIVKLTGEKIIVDGMGEPYDRWVEIYPGGKWVTKSALTRIE